MYTHTCSVWSQPNYQAEYWPMEAGFSLKENFAKDGADAAIASLEILIRNALRLQNQPAVHFMFMSTAKRHGALDWMKSYLGKTGKLQAYRKFAFNGFDHFGEPYNHLIAQTPKESRFRKPSYPGEKIDDQTGWKPGPSHPASPLLD